MKQTAMDAADSEFRFWFGGQIRKLALQHDLGGPHISRVQKPDYRKQLITQIRTRALAATAAQELNAPLTDLDQLCQLAADELIRIREIRYAHETGKLPTEALRQLPIFPAYRDYFEEAPLLVLRELVETLRERRRSESNESPPELSPPPASKESGGPISHQTREWLTAQVIGFAIPGCRDARTTIACLRATGTPHRFELMPTRILHSQRDRSRILKPFF